MFQRSLITAMLIPAAVGLVSAPARAGDTRLDLPKVSYRTVEIDGLNIFYREAGPTDAQTVLLLHGFPTSSHMFRNLIPALADEYHVVAPDYPGFGQSSAPPVDKFNYTFDGLAGVVDKFTEKVGLTNYSIYVQDYGAPVGYRLAVKHPERITGIVVQNGNAYVDGISAAFEPMKPFWANRNEETEKAPRTLLGHHLISEFLLGRVTRKGMIDQLVEIE